MKIGELARLAGSNVETVRYYEREGLLPKPGAERGKLPHLWTNAPGTTDLHSTLSWLGHDT